jgi:hypothetical protein
MQSVYSVYGSPLHLIFEDDFADAVNRACEAFLGAKDLGRTILVNADRKDMDAWNEFAKLMNHLTEINGGKLDILMTDEHIPSNYLVKL